MNHTRFKPETLRLLLIVGGFVVLCLVVVVRNPLPVFVWDMKEANLFRDSKLMIDWEGFGEEKGQKSLL